MIANSDIAVIIPIHEEEHSIRRVLIDLIQNVGSNVSVYLIADDSKDSTIPIVKTFVSEFDCNIKILIQEYSSGPANAIRTGLKFSSEKYIVLMTADDSDNSKDILPLIEILKSGRLVACASRYAKGGQHIGGPKIKHFLSKSAGLFSMFILRTGTSDPTNLFKAVTRNFVSEIEIESSSGFTIGIELVAKAQLQKENSVSEIPTIWHERKLGKSSFKIYKWLPNYATWYFKLIAYKIYSFFNQARLFMGMD